MTAKSLKHKFVSGKADGGDATLVRPSKWNEDHDLYLGMRVVVDATDTLLNADDLCLIKYNRASAITVTVPNPDASNFVSGWVCFIRNAGAGAVTLDCNVGATINGSDTAVVQQNQGVILFSDGDNYEAIVTGVYSFNNRTGAVTPTAGDYNITQIYDTPLMQGRLSLQTTKPIMDQSVPNGTGVYYMPFTGNIISLWQDPHWVPRQLAAEIYCTLDATNWATSNNYDFFLALDSGTLRLGYGPAWTSGTARGTGAGTTQIQQYAGLWLNTNQITLRYDSTHTFTVGAFAATYVGTGRCGVTAGIIKMEFSATPATGGNNNKLFLWNAYNRVKYTAYSRDSDNIWAVPTSWTMANSSYGNNSVSWIDGLGQSFVTARNIENMYPDTSVGVSMRAGVCLDNSNASNGLAGEFYSNTVNVCGTVFGWDTTPGLLGVHYYAAVEMRTAGTTVSAQGAGTGRQMQLLEVELEM